MEDFRAEDLEASLAAAASDSGMTLETAATQQRSQQSQQQQQQLQQIPPEAKKWPVLYACYFDPTVPQSKGRRLPISKLAGCEDPYPYDIAACLAEIGYRNIIIEGKKHPSYRILRNFQAPPQRVRVQIKSATDTPIVAHISTKEQLLAAVAERMPTCAARKHRILQIEAMKQQQMQQQLEMQKQAAAAQRGPNAGAGASPRQLTAPGAAASGSKPSSSARGRRK